MDLRIIVVVLIAVAVVDVAFVAMTYMIRKRTRSVTVPLNIVHFFSARDRSQPHTTIADHHNACRWQNRFYDASSLSFFLTSSSS
jgi:hypothetical protein